MPYLPAPQSMEHREGPCAEPASPSERVCLTNCEYSVNKPKLTGEIALLDVIVGLSVIMIVMGVLLRNQDLITPEIMLADGIAT